MSSNVIWTLKQRFTPAGDVYTFMYNAICMLYVMAVRWTLFRRFVLIGNLFSTAFPFLNEMEFTEIYRNKYFNCF